MVKITFVIPTLNAQKVLEKCLKSIIKQDYPQKNYEILIADGGSTDKTLLIAKKYNSKIYKNPLKTAEAGKAVGVNHAKGQYICLIDSDNIIPNKNWLKKMLLPLETNSKIIGSEPIEFTYRPSGGIIERYSALIGANDPYAFITDVYDRKNFINNQWTGLKIDQIDKGQYLEIKLKPKSLIPTIGANGTIFRTDFLKKNLKSDYLFDIDIISQVINQTKKEILFAKVKVGIIHTFCESSINKFIRKQKRRLVDYYSYQHLRQYNWAPVNQNGQKKFILYSLFIFPSLFDSIRGFTKKPDPAWFLHPILCFITLFYYTFITLKFKIGLLKPINRNSWQQ
ncbi:MAG: glycosyltransferase family 2 protein [Candidatus Shapirobacteria bacterium]|nr:glycosyltransferase family 2 protein [Candidatus Shapirobacteria bacterium]